MGGRRSCNNGEIQSLGENQEWREESVYELCSLYNEEVRIFFCFAGFLKRHKMFPIPLIKMFHIV